MPTRDTYNSFNTIIKGAIDEFNNIHSAIAQKGGTNLNGEALSSNGTGTPSSHYFTIIQRQLWTVSNPNGASGVISDTTFNGGIGTITNYDESTLNLTVNQTSAYNVGGSVTLTGKVNAHGYFTENSVFSYTLSGTVLDITGSLKSAASWSQDNLTQLYEFTPASNTILSKVRVRPADVSIGSDGISATNTSITYTNKSLGNTSSLLIGLNDATGLGTSPYSFVFNTSTRANAELSADAAVTVDNAGYINDASEITGTNTQSDGVLNISRGIGSGAGDISITGSSADTIYIKKGNIDIGQKDGGVLTISPAADVAYETSVTNANNYYKIQADVTEFSYPDAQISEGYFKNEAVTVEGDASTSAIYIAKGSTDNVTTDVTLDVTSNPSGLTTNASSGYSLTISNSQGGNQSSTGIVHPGYSNQTSYTASVTGLSKTITLPIGSVTINNGTLSVAGVTQTGGVTELGTGTSDGYALKVNVTMPMTPTIAGVGGYVKETSQIHTTPLSGTTASNTIYIGKGTASYTPQLAFELTDASGNGQSGTYGQTGSGEPITLASLFKTTRPGTGIDYWTITNTINRNSFQEGYFKSGNDTLNAGQTYYLPKAVVEWVDNGDGEEDYLQVVSPGYLPSGILSNISTASTLETASVSTVLSIPNVTVVNTAGSGATANYPISIGKGVIDAGYISATQGTITLAQNYYIKHGAAHVIAVLGTPQVGGFLYNASNGTYDATVSGSVSISNSSTFTEGYLKEEDLTTATDNTATTTLSIAKIGMQVNGAALGKNAVKPAMSLVGMTEDPSSAFGVSVDLSALEHFFTPAVSTTGYGATGDTGAQAQLTGTGTINVKAATINKSVNGTVGVSISNNFSSTVNGDYTLTPSITPSLSAAVNEGYVGSTGMAIGMQSGGVALGTVSGTTVAHGNITVTGTATPSLAGAANGTIPAPVIYTSSAATTANGEKYVKLTATATANTTRTLFKAGYIKTTDVTLNNNPNSDNWFIRLISGYGTTTSLSDANADAYTQQVEVDSELPIADQYINKNFVITIGPNAAGTNVQNHLTLLQKRMAGTLTQGEYNSAFGAA